MVEYARESADIFDEIFPLVQMHAKEIAYGVTADEPLDIALDTYRALEQAGALCVFTVRSEGRLVGYAIFHLGQSLDRKYIKQAHEGGLFLLPECRGGRTAMRLLEFADAELANLGCNTVLYSSPAANPKFGAMLSRLGYEKVDEVYARRL